MQISRFLLPMSKDLCSCTSRLGTVVLGGAARGITTGGSHVKLGNVGGKMGNIPPIDEMAAFLGKWLLVKTTYHKGHDLAKKRDIKIGSDELAPSQFYVRYERYLGTWTVEHGVVGVDKKLIYEFQMNQVFNNVLPSGTRVRTIVYPMDNYMKWEQQNLDNLEITKSTAEVNGNKLTWSTLCPNKSKITKQYIKE